MYIKTSTYYHNIKAGWQRLIDTERMLTEKLSTIEKATLLIVQFH